jgi:hypothetical protein
MSAAPGAIAASLVFSGLAAAANRVVARVTVKRSSLAAAIRRSGSVRKCKVLQGSTRMVRSYGLELERVWHKCVFCIECHGS